MYAAALDRAQASDRDGRSATRERGRSGGCQGAALLTAARAAKLIAVIHRARSAILQVSGRIEVHFTLLAERYERRSVLITSNLVFSE